MVRQFNWRLVVRSYETDFWGQAPASVILRYLEQSAVIGAADRGYDKQWHDRHGVAWVIRRMWLAIHGPAEGQDELEITTWATDFGKVRAGREYQVMNLTSGLPLAGAWADWVHINRKTMAPAAIPPRTAADFDVPGAPLGSYKAPPVAPAKKPFEMEVRRVAGWSDCDSMGHVNNTVYVDWLDDAFRGAIEALGWNLRDLHTRGLQIRGEFYQLDYKRAAVPGDELVIRTRIEGVEDRLCAVRQTISGPDGTEYVAASTVYGWQTALGKAVDAPDGWGDRLNA